MLQKVGSIKKFFGADIFQGIIGRYDIYRYGQISARYDTQPINRGRGVIVANFGISISRQVRPTISRYNTGYYRPNCYEAVADDTTR